MIDSVSKDTVCGARIGCIVSKKQRANGWQWNLHKRDWALQHLRKQWRPLTLLKVILITWFQNIENEEIR
jgi:hypothetical protein